MSVIGIDLGTTMSVAACYRNNTVEIIPDTLGNRLIPSQVGFLENEYYVGRAAKNQAIKNSENTIYDAKRFIGHTSIPTDLLDAKYPFSISVDEKIKFYIPVLDRWMLPEEISAMILSYIKKNAESYLDTEITGAVITVPAYFNNDQKKCTKNAAKIAGLNVIRIVNEPTAAALAYGYGFNCESLDKTILIVDIGGGTTDLTILDIDGDVIEVKATRGDMHFGGSDFDEKLVDYCLSKFHHPELDFNTEDEVLKQKINKAIRRLRSECEKAKIALSSGSSTEIEIDSLFMGSDFSITISRAKFENLNSKYFRKIRDLLSNVLKDAQRTKTQIDEIILVGGSTRIPKIRSIIREYFNGKKLSHTLHPDEAVASGAALQAHYLAGDCDENEKVLLMDVIPLSLGIETKGGIMDVIMEKNTIIPAKKSSVYSTAKDGQNSVTVKVFEGERVLCADNKLLGKFNLRGIVPASKGIAQIEVVFEVDENGLLNVSAFDQANPGKIQNISIDSSTNLSAEEIENLINIADEMGEKDELIKKKVEIWDKLESIIYCVEEMIAEASNETRILVKDDQYELDKIIDNTRKWMFNNSNFKDEDFDLTKLTDKHFEVHSMVDQVMNRIYTESQS